MGLLERLKEKISNLFVDEEAVKLLLEEAKSYDAKERYEDACYSYACAVERGLRAPQYNERIRYLVRTYGPFSFGNQLERMKKEYCHSCESCGEGYHVGIVDLVKRIVESA